MFVILPVGMDYRARRYPVVTFTIMGICIAVWLAGLACKLAGNAEAAQDWEFEHLWLIPSESHWWTYVTSVFVHGGFLHLFGNMIYLFLFGSCVEDMIGRLHFTLFYLICGVGSALAYIMFSPEHFASDIPEGGASGAISACIGGYLLLRARANISFKWILVLFFRLWSGDFALPAWVVISFWFLKDFGLMLLSASENKHGGGVAFGAHVGGTLLGMGFIALEKIRLKKNPLPEVDEEEEPRPIRPVQTVRPVVHAKAEARVIPLKTAVKAETPTIHLFWNGTQSGPFTPSQIQQMFASGEIPPDALYWREGMADWTTAEELRTPA